MELGTELCRYSVRNEQLTINEGVVSEVGIRKVVNFENGGASVGCPRKCDVGVVRNVGPTLCLWLERRDDERAIKMLISFEERRIKQLRSLIDSKTRIVENLNNLKKGLD